MCDIFKSRFWSQGRNMVRIGIHALKSAQEEKSRAEPESVGDFPTFETRVRLVVHLRFFGNFPTSFCWMDCCRKVDVSCFVVVFASWLLRSKLSAAGQQQMEKSSSMWLGWYQRHPQNGGCELMESLRSLHYCFFLRSDEHLPNFIASSDAEFCMETSQVLDQICWFSAASVESKSHWGMVKHHITWHGLTDGCRSLSKPGALKSHDFQRKLEPSKQRMGWIMIVPSGPLKTLASRCL